MAFHRPLKRYLLNEGAPPLAVDLRTEVSKFDTCLCFVFRRNCLAVGVITTHTDDLLGCGVSGVLNKIEKFLSTRSGPVELREDNFAHVGMDVFRKNDGPVEITQGTFTDLVRPITKSPPLWKDRNRPLHDVEMTA